MISTGGEAVLNTSEITAYRGVELQGAGSRLTMLGGTITIKDEAIWAQVGSSVILDAAYHMEIEPQLQLLYQHLSFHSAYDRGDNFAVDLGNHGLFLMKIGGHVTKRFINTLSNREASFYAKLHYVHSLNKGQEVDLGDETFLTGNFGNHIEAGLGLHALQSDNTSLYGEAIWQEKISSAGFSGIRFNGGIRVQF